jgi:hypothetical protein
MRALCQYDRDGMVSLLCMTSDATTQTAAGRPTLSVCAFTI